MFSIIISCLKVSANDFPDNSFLIGQLTPTTYQNNQLFNFIHSNSWTGLELAVSSDKNSVYLENSNIPFSDILEKMELLLDEKQSKILPVFIHYQGDVHILDSIIMASSVSGKIFYLPQGERWPSIEYLVQANRRMIFFFEGELQNNSKILHQSSDYALQINANQLTLNSSILTPESNINKELFKIHNFNRLPTGVSTSLVNQNLYPEYINYLLESWTKYGKKPNFIFVENKISNFGFIVEQLNSFEAVKGQVKTSGKNLERVFWRNSEILITGGKFSFPIRGGEEMILSPFVPGFSLAPAQLTITSEMAKPESYSILATPLELNRGLMASFHFDNTLLDKVNPDRSFEGKAYTYSQDIDRGSVLRLPEGARINLGHPEMYNLPNSSFTISCFAKFTDILEFGDNAILGNNEQSYRRGLHLVLRSGHPYFGLYANDFMSGEVLESNKWYHLTWRYILETGQQEIFVNGQHVGGSDGHPPYSGTNDIFIGSALSGGASLRGYIDNLNIWDRPLGNEEINRLALDEEISYQAETATSVLLSAKIIVSILSLILAVFLVLIFVLLRKMNAKKQLETSDTTKKPTQNKIQLFGEFKAISATGEDLTDLFTPKIRELFIYILFQSTKNDAAAAIGDINKTLWHGIEAKKVANNRAVTLNKLRKILIQFNQVEIAPQNGYLNLKFSEDFFCDYIEAFYLCTTSGGMSEGQLREFFHLVKRGPLLKDSDWPWLDEIRGFTGNQVIDNLLKLASIYKTENKPKEVEKVSQRILDYDDLNEEALYLQIWALQKAKNTHLAKFNFETFCSRFQKSMGESYSMNFKEFTHFYAKQY